jgi:hypothetical protein
MTRFSEFFIAPQQVCSLAPPLILALRFFEGGVRIELNSYSLCFFPSRQALRGSVYVIAADDQAMMIKSDFMDGT